MITKLKSQLYFDIPCNISLCDCHCWYPPTPLSQGGCFMASLATCVRSALSPSISPFYASQLAHFVIGCHSSVQQLLRRPSSNCIFCHYELVSGSPPWHTPSTEFAESWPNVSGSSLWPYSSSSSPFPPASAAGAKNYVN